MTNHYKVELNLPLPQWPSQAGIPEPQQKPVPLALLEPGEFPTAAEALDHAREIVALGYGVSITDPAGREWQHAEVLRVLAERQ